MTRYQEKKITVNDAQLVYLHDHENTKTPLLFLHGALYVAAPYDRIGRYRITDGFELASLWRLCERG